MTDSEILKSIDKIQKELQQLKEELQNNFKWAVYYHLLPNGKYYIGIAKDIKQRWQGGEGYKPNTEFYKAIKQYSWDNIKHTILCRKETKREAEAIEKILIRIYEANNIKYGYNKKSFFKDSIDKENLKALFNEELQELNLKELEEAHSKREGARV